MVRASEYARGSCGERPSTVWATHRVTLPLRQDRHAAMRTPEVQSWAWTVPPRFETSPCLRLSGLGRPTADTYHAGPRRCPTHRQWRVFVCAAPPWYAGDDAPDRTYSAGSERGPQYMDQALAATAPRVARAGSADLMIRPLRRPRGPGVRMLLASEATSSVNSCPLSTRVRTGCAQDKIRPLPPATWTMVRETGPRRVSAQDVSPVRGSSEPHNRRSLAVLLAAVGDVADPGFRRRSRSASARPVAGRVAARRILEDLDRRSSTGAASAAVVRTGTPVGEPPAEGRHVGLGCLFALLSHVHARKHHTGNVNTCSVPSRNRRAPVLRRRSCCW